MLKLKKNMPHKRNKYIIKYTVPNRWGNNNIHYSNVDVICSDEDTAFMFFESICKVCISDLEKNTGVKVTANEIDFQMIALVDIVQLKAY